jgi:hypothetical protein
MLNKSLCHPIRISWIKGHQDEKVDYNKLSHHAQLNMDDDSLATGHRHQPLPQSSPHINHLLRSQITIKFSGYRLTSKTDVAIHYHENSYHMRQCLQTRPSWTNTSYIWEAIGWYHFGKHFNSLTPRQQTSHMKCVHDQQPLGTRRLQKATIKDAVLHLCPCCKAVPKTQFHMLQCRDNKSHATIISTLTRSIRDSDTHPVKHFLTAGFQSWFDDLTALFRLLSPNFRVIIILVFSLPWRIN